MNRIRKCAAALLLLLVPSLFSQKLVFPPKTLSKTRLGPKCSKETTIDAQLGCWLDENPKVANAMIFGDATYYGTWKYWPISVKEELAKDFKLLAGWYLEDTPSTTAPQLFPVIVVPTGPVDPVWSLWMSEKLGRSIYLSVVANNLAVELTGYLPWTITTYGPAELSSLLNQSGLVAYVTNNIVKPGYYFNNSGMYASPANPPFTALFFKKNQLIGSSAADTIERLFRWERRLQHVIDPPGVPKQDIAKYYFGPNIPPIPDAEIIEGTTYSGPSGVGLTFDHYTNGCGGTMEFMKSVLRTVNIPVQENWLACGHAAPTFPTVNMALDHGDDPYDALGIVTPYPGFPAPQTKEFFISVPQFNQWFPGGACLANVGRQVSNVAIQYASDRLMHDYCDDQTSGASHAAGEVYSDLKQNYSVQDLENMGLWTTLANKDAALNWCATIYK